jgi:hypothetical protein
MKEEILKAIKTYQVPGCVNDFDENNIVQQGVGVEWSEHVAGTSVTSPRGLERIYLGMPRPFSRLGKAETPINIFESWEQLKDKWSYDKFNIPCWKYLDENGNTLVRGLSPRINTPFLHIIIGDCIDQIDCYQLTKEDIDGMD